MSLSFVFPSVSLNWDSSFCPLCSQLHPAWLPGGPLQVFTDNNVVTTNPYKAVDPLSCRGPPSWPCIRASAAGSRPLRVLHDETLIFSADQGASINPRGRQQHFGRKEAAVVNGHSRTAPDGWEEARPSGNQTRTRRGPEASFSPGRLANIAGWSWLVLVRKGAHGERQDRPPKPLQVCVEDPVGGEGASCQLLKKPRLSSGCAGALSCRRTVQPHARMPARPSPPGRPPPACPVSFPAQSASDVPEALASLAGGCQVGGGTPLSTCPSLAQGHRAVGRKQPKQPLKCSLKSRSITAPSPPPPSESWPDVLDFEASNLSLKWAGPVQGPGRNEN